MTRKPTAQCEGKARSAVYAKATVEPTPRKDVLECKVRPNVAAPFKLREGKIQERAGITKDAARKDVDDWLNRQ